MHLKHCDHARTQYVDIVRTMYIPTGLFHTESTITFRMWYIGCQGGIFFCRPSLQRPISNGGSLRLSRQGTATCFRVTSWMGVWSWLGKKGIPARQFTAPPWQY